MPRSFGLMAVAVGLATPARGGRDRASTQVAQRRNLMGDASPLLIEGLQGLGNRHFKAPPILAYLIRTDYCNQKRQQPVLPFQVARPCNAGTVREFFKSTRLVIVASCTSTYL